MSRPELLGLPNEILLEIVQYLHDSTSPRDRQRDLFALSVMCRQLRTLAFDKWSPLLHPIVHLSKVPSLVKAYSEQPDIIPNVHSLEIYSAPSDPALLEQDKANRIHGVWPRPISYGHPLENSLMMFCSDIIQGTRMPYYGGGDDAAIQQQMARDQWLKELQTNYQPAFLAVLLSCLPNLRDLHISQNYFIVIPFKGWSMRSDPRGYKFDPCTYAQSCFSTLLHRLTALDLPAVCTQYTWEGVPCQKEPIRIPGYNKLRYLSLPFRFLDRGNSMVSRGVQINMKTIEVLRVVDIENDDMKDWILALPVMAEGTQLMLRRIELYHCTPEPPHWDRTRKEMLEAAEKIDAELYMWHPKGYGKENFEFRAIHANGQPWHYSQDELDKMERKAAGYALKRLGERREGYEWASGDKK